ncbi:transcriptional regulator protein yobu-related [Anaeramoeba ignava]|uniref:Transcriptional regulator protein yobu-related n=1 Tax=Anaeramoeba ignava TaxID=1746090 RepID=A0A9Q0LAM4_ANAIG|nr:transcriptional regulator protein yobu-related [Anaeramoeba ignava]
MEPKFVTKKAFYIVGYQTDTGMQDPNRSKNIKKQWTKMVQGKLFEKIKPVEKGVFLGGCFDWDEKTMDWSYLAGIEVESVENIPEGTTWRKLPDSLYAIFTVKGKLEEKILPAYEEIMKNWLPNNKKYVRANSPDFEYYDHRYKENSDDSEFDIWIPIEEKKD